MSALTKMALMAAALGVALPMPLARSAKVDAERTDADREALQAAADKRARKAAKRLATQAPGVDAKGKDR